MSEDQADYITDALEMIGLSEPKKIVQEISGFVPVFDVIMDFYEDHITALVFGRRWQYCRMEDGVCRASLSRLAKDLHMDEATVMRHTEKLVTDGYLIDTTPDRRNRPHVYADAGRVVMKSFLGVAQSNTSIAQSNVGIAQSKLIKQDNTKNNEKDLLEGILQNDKHAQQITDAQNDFEAALGFGSLPWGGKGAWAKFSRFVADLHAKDPQAFTDYAEWRRGEGKYQAMSNNKIRQDPQSFMDTGWPTFLAHAEMQKPPIRPEYQPYIEPEANYVPNPLPKPRIG